MHKMDYEDASSKKRTQQKTQTNIKNTPWGTTIKSKLESGRATQELLVSGKGANWGSR